PAAARAPCKQGHSHFGRCFACPAPICPEFPTPSPAPAPARTARVAAPERRLDPMASSCRCSNWWWKRKRQTSRAEGPARQERAAGGAEEVWATSGGKRRALRAKRR
ncbi:unnamed protein product, partial [Bubo scandiacus]